MGFDPSMFVDQPVDEEMICAICHAVQDKPTTACQNGHTFCAVCLEEWEKQGSKQCPDCRKDIVSEKVLCRPLQAMILKRTVECINKNMATEDEDGGTNSNKRARVHVDEEENSTESNNNNNNSIKKKAVCEWQGSLERYLEKHSASECRFAKAACEKCNKTFSVSDIQAHRESECLYRLTDCPHCGTKQMQKLLKSHISIACPEIEVACRHCGEKILRKFMGKENYNVNLKQMEYTGHTRVCPRQPVLCGFNEQGCFQSVPREELDQHHAKFARKHAELVSKELQSIREGKYWTAALIDWVIPHGRLRRMTSVVSYSPESHRVKVGDYQVFLKLVLSDEENKVKAKVCVEDPDLGLYPPSIDRLSLDYSVGEHEWQEEALEMSEAKKMEKEEEEDDEGSTIYSVGGTLSFSACDDDGYLMQRDAHVTDMINEEEEVDRCVIRARFRLKAPDRMVIGCQR